MRRLVSLVCFTSVLSACGTTLPMVRGEYDLLRVEIHQAKAAGAMECSSVNLAEAQLGYRFASLELAQGDFDRAGQHVASGRLAVAEIKTSSTACSAEGVTPKDLGADPWADADGDGVSDRDDICPYGLEDRDGFSDSDGCSEPDNDLDGVLDADDKCPFEAEDIDGTQDEDGCPETDDDGDGVLDSDDLCPTEAEVVNGFLDEDGCPDLVPEHVTLSAEAVGFTQPLKFLGEGKELLGVGPRAVEELASWLMSSPEVHLRVVGHTSNRGDAVELQQLSALRAQAVVDILISTGVAAERLEASGRGGEFPVATNRTRSGRKQNSRIELELVSGKFLGFN